MELSYSRLGVKNHNAHSYEFYVTLIRFYRLDGRKGRTADCGNGEHFPT